MIDFRYHLISIVAVLLALGVGLVVGSGFIGGPLLEDIQNRAENIRDSNAELRSQLEERGETIAMQGDFAQEVQPYILGNSLRDVGVVLVETDGVPGSVTESAIGAIEAAGGGVTTTIELQERFALDDDIEMDELALILGSAQEDADAIRIEAASTLGSRLGAGAEATEGAGARARVQDLLDELEEGDFVSVTRPSEDGPLVPPGAAFVLVAGSDSEPPFPVAETFVELSLGLARRGHAVVVVESRDSEWGAIASVLDESEARAGVATASGIDLPAGGIAAVMALDRAREGIVEHVGFGLGASSVLPEPTGAPPD